MSGNFVCRGPLALRHPWGLGTTEARPCHPSSGLHSSRSLASGNSSLPFLLFRKHQQQSHIPVLGDGHCLGPAGMVGRELFPPSPVLTTTVLPLPSLPAPGAGSQQGGGPWENYPEPERRSRQTVPRALAGAWIQDASSTAQPPVGMC